MSSLNLQTIASLREETKQAEEELRKDREALERVEAILKRHSKQEFKVDVVGLAMAKSPKLTLSSAVREALQSMDKSTSRELKSYIEKKYPNLGVSQRMGTLSSILNRLVEMRKLTTEGTSDQPGKALTYIKTDSFSI